MLAQNRTNVAVPPSASRSRIFHMMLHAVRRKRRGEWLHCGLDGRVDRCVIRCDEIVSARHSAADSCLHSRRVASCGSGGSELIGASCTLARIDARGARGEGGETEGRLSRRGTERRRRATTNARRGDARGGERSGGTQLLLFFFTFFFPLLSPPPPLSLLLVDRMIHHSLRRIERPVAAFLFLLRLSLLRG